MRRRFGLRLAAILLAVSPSTANAAPVDLSPAQDAALNQLFAGAGAGNGNGAGAAAGNPYLLKPARKPAAPLPRAAPAIPAASGDPINLLPPLPPAPAAKTRAAAAAPPDKTIPAKSPLPAIAPPAVQTAKLVAMPLPRLRPGDEAGQIPRLELRRPAAADDNAPAKVSPKDEPVGDGPDANLAAGAAPAAPAVPPAPAQPAHPASTNGRALPESPIELPDQPFSAAPPPTPPANAAPYQLVRALQQLQDQTAQGSAAAFIAERQLRIRIEDSFAKADGKVWQDRLNAAAAVTYVLSGGAPDVLRRLSTLTPAPAIDHKLIIGALAYVEGKVDEASAALADVAANDLPASMGGQMALAQAALAVGSDPQHAIQLLDTARLLAPGTLVEEAALRREILVADEIGDQAKFEALSRQYLTRFRHSVYAGNFRYRFAAILTHLKFGDEAGQARTLDDMFKGLEPSTARELYLTVARAAVVQGKTGAAALASERAGTLAVDGSADQARAHLYRAAALAVLPDNLDKAIAERKAVTPELLNRSDRALLEAASATIDAVAKADQATDKVAGDPAVPGSADPSPVMLHAETALQAADALLKETKR